MWLLVGGRRYFNYLRIRNGAAAEDFSGQWPSVSQKKGLCWMITKDTHIKNGVKIDSQ